MNTPDRRQINAEASTSHVPLPRAPRVSQVDADELDEGLVSMLSERVERSFGNFQWSLAQDLKPEISLLLKLVIFRLGILDPLIQASPGAKLQNLRLASISTPSHHPTRRKLLLYLILHPPIFPTYLLTRIRQYALSNQWPDLPAHDWRRRAWKGILKLENAARVWELAGWGWFLWDGRYPSLLMRLLDLRLVPSSRHLTKLVSYEFMNRQLVWGAFTEFLMTAVPLIPPIPSFLTPGALISPLRTFLSQSSTVDYTALTHTSFSTSVAGLSKVSASAHTGPLAHLPKETCPICHLRYTSAPIPLDASTSQGSSFSLPPILTFPTSTSGEEAKEETRVYVPAQTDCWGGCQWCYYCIAGELGKHQECVRLAERSKPKIKKEKQIVWEKVQSRVKERTREKEHFRVKEKVQDTDTELNAVLEEEKWNCLRCGGGVTRAWRVGPTEPVAVAL